MQYSGLVTALLTARPQEQDSKEEEATCQGSLGEESCQPTAQQAETRKMHLRLPLPPALISPASHSHLLNPTGSQIVLLPIGEPPTLPGWKTGCRREGGRKVDIEGHNLLPSNGIEGRAAEPKPGL